MKPTFEKGIMCVLLTCLLTLAALSVFYTPTTCTEVYFINNEMQIWKGCMEDLKR